MTESSRKQAIELLKSKEVTDVFLGVEVNGMMSSIVILGKTKNHSVLPFGRIGMMEMDSISFIRSALRKGVAPIQHEMTTTAILYDMIAAKLGMGDGFEEIFSKAKYRDIPNVMTTESILIDSLLEEKTKVPSN